MAEKKHEPKAPEKKEPSAPKLTPQQEAEAARKHSEGAE